MSGFDVRDIRRAMDVYTLDNVYLGAVVETMPGTVPAEQEQRIPEGPQGGKPHGEALGPMPTVATGNRAPEIQGADNRYTTEQDGAQKLGQGAIRVGKWWGLKRIIPMDLVQTVSLERVVLKVPKSKLG